MSASRLLLSRVLVASTRSTAASLASTSRHLIAARPRRLHSSPAITAASLRVKCVSPLAHFGRRPRSPGDAQAYAAASDEAMDSLVDSLAELIEDEGAPLSGWECDYSVR